MDRQIVSEEELLGWLNAELSKHDECDDCRFTSVMRLRGTDVDGCNWSSPNLRCSGRPVEPCTVIANELVAQAHARFQPSSRVMPNPSFKRDALKHAPYVRR